MRSLRSRAILSGIWLSVLSLFVGAVVLVTSVDDIALRRFDTDIAARHLQLTVALANGGLDADVIASELTDPLYDRPYSGRYWQINALDGTIATSRSLFDAILTLPVATSELQYSNGFGPNGDVRIAWRQITSEGNAPMVVAVASSLDELDQERWNIRRSLLTGFTVVGLLGLIIATLQTSAILRPLTTLQQDINKRWESDEAIDPANYPKEVAPLVNDINILLARNRNIIDRTRRQGADLAHALKTPAAILRNELHRFGQAGQTVGVAQDALDRIDAQITRSLTRVRAANVAGGAQRGTNLRGSLDRLARTFATLFADNRRSLDIDVLPDLAVSMDAQDLEDVLGNILENGLKFCRSRVVIRAHRTETMTFVRIEDDGPGIPEPDRVEALRPGGRLDTATRGTGLGLAIALDIVNAYGGTLTLGQSTALGGLQVEWALPIRRGL